MTQVQCNLDARADPLLTARRTEFQQIFINLMNNAVDAMKGGGTLNVILEEETSGGLQWVKVTVQDTGEGIPEDIRQRIFEPFFTTKAPGKGTGLGLSIVRDIVANGQGVLEVNSQIHQGTTFVVRLPLLPPAAEAVAAELKSRLKEKQEAVMREGESADGKPPLLPESVHDLLSLEARNLMSFLRPPALR